MTKRYWLFIILIMLCPSLFAQDETTPEKTAPIGNFDSQGQFSVGYRFTDVRGYHPEFLQLFDLNKGFRLQDLHLSGEAKEKAGSFADSYWLSANGLGGDPFPTAQLGVHKAGLYDLRVNWRQSYYYWNQNDNAVLPIASLAGVSTGLTDNHNWATVRKFGSADLTIHATNNLRFSLDMFHTTNDGILLTTRSLDFFNSPSYWGGFARANAYNLWAPLHDETNRVDGGLDYTRRSWTFHYKTGYQSFGETMSLNNVTTGEVSIDPVTASRNEPLTQLSWSQARRLTTPISEFSFAGKPGAKLDWRGSYIYYRYQGPASLDQAFSGTAPGATAGSLVPYNISQSGRANVIAPNHIASEGFTYRIRPWWDLNADYRYSRFTSAAVGSLESLLNGTAYSTGGDNTAWRSGIGDLDVNMMFSPGSKFTFSPGVRLTKADIEALDGGIVDSTRSLRTKTASPEIRFSYRPSTTFSIRGDLHSTTNGSSYTIMTPHTQVSERVVVRYQPIAKFSLEDSMLISDSKLLDSSYQNNIRTNSLMLSYAWNARFSIFAGLAYDSFFATGNILYARGAAPLNDTLRDQEINRVWQGGFEAKPVRHVGVRFTGNYDRSTGVGQISGEPPAYGPLKWPMATGTVYFDVPKAGRLSLDFQRTYYIEQIVAANNFSANLLTIRWTRSIF